MNRWVTIGILMSLVGCTPIQPTHLPLKTNSERTHFLPIKNDDLTFFKNATGQVTPMKQGDHLQFHLILPASFHTQALPTVDIRYMRLWVEGPSMTDRMWNTEGYTDVANNPFDVTLTVTGVPKGANRVVTAQAYDANKQPIPGASVQGYYNSPTDTQSAVTVYLKWDNVPVANTLQKLLNLGSSKAGSLDSIRLQQLLNKIMYGNSEGTGNRMVHPARLNPNAIANRIESTGTLPDETTIPEDWLYSDNQAIFIIRDPNGNPYQIGDIILTVTDPASGPVTLESGQDTATVDNVAPGEWNVIASLPNNNTVKIETTVKIEEDGNVVVNNGDPTPISFPNSPKVNSLDVIQGFNVIDTAITITGEQFKNGATVKVGTMAATNVVVVNDTTITATFPSGLASGMYNVTVINPDPLSGTKTGAFTAISGMTTITGDGTNNFGGDGILAVGAQITRPGAVNMDTNGNLLIVTTDRVRCIPATTATYYGQAMTAGNIYTIAGNGVNGAYAGGDEGAVPTTVSVSASDVFVDTNGHLFIADDGNYRIRMVPASDGTYYGQAMNANRIYTIAGDGSTTYNPGDEGVLPTNTGLNRPTGVYVDTGGNVLIANYSNDRVQFIPATDGTYYGQAMNAERIYTIAGDGNSGYSGDGGLGTAANIGNPSDVYMDSQGNALIVEYWNGVIRKVATDGIISTVAGDNALSWSYSGDGGLATAAALSGPWQMYIDTNDNMFIADLWNHTIRKVATNGIITTIAGDAYDASGKDDGDWIGRFNGDNQAATSASMDRPSGVVIDSKGVMYIGDWGISRVRKVIL